ncbi:thermonuclease family protein [Brevundimonas sp. GCM10030266]|uniref:thermonuclease family protein n=1 Tax=Brevundimonas sp. GCM10030266 TaxID=3273386 RepID=UPI00360C3C72
MIHALPPDPPAIIGEAIAVDGDTIEIGGQRIRLWGIDAPEGRQSCIRDGEHWDCGQVATFHVVQMIMDREVKCEPVGRPDRYRRIVARCSVKWELDGGEAGWEWADLNRQIVRNGWALNYDRYSGGEYREDEALARLAKAGLWAGEFQMPWEWRSR